MEAAEEAKERGDAAYAKKRYDDACDEYSRAMALRLDHHIYFADRSAAHLAAGRAQEALADATRAIELAPQRPEGHVRKCRALMELNDLSALRDASARGLALQPTDPAVLDELNWASARAAHLGAAVAMAEGRFEDVRELASSGIEFDSGVASIGLYLYRIWACQRLGDLDAVLADALVVTEMAPKSRSAYIAAAVVFLSRSDFDNLLRVTDEGLVECGGSPILAKGNFEKVNPYNMFGGRPAFGECSLEDAERLMRLAPDCEGAFALAAAAHAQAGDFEAMERVLALGGVKCPHAAPKLSAWGEEMRRLQGRCANCGQPADESCARCGMVVYCGDRCRTLHSFYHERGCRAISVQQPHRSQPQRIRRAALAALVPTPLAKLSHTQLQEILDGVHHALVQELNLRGDQGPPEETANRIREVLLPGAKETEDWCTLQFKLAWIIAASPELVRLPGAWEEVGRRASLARLNTGGGRSREVTILRIQAGAACALGDAERELDFAEAALLMLPQWGSRHKDQTRIDLHVQCATLHCDDFSGGDGTERVIMHLEAVLPLLDVWNEQRVWCVSTLGLSLSSRTRGDPQLNRKRAVRLLLELIDREEEIKIEFADTAHFAVATCLDRLGHLVKAAEHYEKWLRQPLRRLDEGTINSVMAHQALAKVYLRCCGEVARTASQTFEFARLALQHCKEIETDALMGEAYMWLDDAEAALRSYSRDPATLATNARLVRTARLAVGKPWAAWTRMMLSAEVVAPSPSPSPSSSPSPSPLPEKSFRLAQVYASATGATSTQALQFLWLAETRFRSAERQLEADGRRAEAQVVNHHRAKALLEQVRLKRGSQ